MLGFFGKKSDHPLADIKTAQQLIHGVPTNDAATAVQELTGWIESLLELADDFRLDHEFAVLRMLDEAAQPFLRKLIREYFTAASLSKFQENRQWTVLNSFYTQSELVHHDVLTRFRNGGRGASSIRTELPLLGARGIAALTGRLKMALARYTFVDPVLWNHLADFFGHAETHGYQNEKVSMYVGVPSNTSVSQEFAVLLVWYAMSAGSHSPLQAHLAERFIAHVGNRLSAHNNFDSERLHDFDMMQLLTEVGNRISVHSNFNSERLYVFDMLQSSSPTGKVAPGVQLTLRYIRTGDAINLLNDLFKNLAKGVVPDNLYLFGSNYEAEMLSPNLRRLIDSLTLPVSIRRNPRRKVNVNLKVVNGFHKMVAQTDVELSFTQDAETWDAEDISATGFRSVVPADRADGIKVGSLIGSKPENIPHWGAGIVRRLSRDEKNNLHIGVEVLSPQIIGVSLKDRVHHGGAESLFALYLNRPTDDNEEALLLMRSDTFSMKRTLSMGLDGKDYLLLPLALLENGDDYDLARYRCMEQVDFDLDEIM